LAAAWRVVSENAAGEGGERLSAVTGRAAPMAKLVALRPILLNVQRLRE